MRVRIKEKPVKKRWVIVCVLLLCVCLPPAWPGAAEEVFFSFDGSAAPGNTANELYVAENGNDSGSGTQLDPLLTLAEAVARLVNAPGGEAWTIWMRGGTYLISQTIYITLSHLSEVCVRPYPGETPVITGATRLEGWMETGYQGQTVWSTRVPSMQLMALYGEDGARRASRWPKTGTFSAKGPVEASDDKMDRQQALYVDPADMPSTLQGARLRLLHWWKDELSGIRSYDPSGGFLLLNREMSMTVVAGDRYFYENVLGVPLLPGEWVYDRETEMLFYAPMPGEEAGETPLYAGTHDLLFVIMGSSGITFDGITFARTGWSVPYYDARADFPQAAYDAGTTILVVGSQNITFKGCTFRDIGAGCIRFDQAVKFAVVKDCTFENIGAQAVYVLGQNTAEEGQITESIFIVNNHINGYGKSLYNAAAVLIIHARDVEISHNEIHDGTYTAISAGWVWGSGYNVTDAVRIQNNWLYNIGQGLLSDMGAIYLLGSQPNTVVSDNVIHDVVTAEYGGWGIYLDEGAAHITVERNIVFDCSAQGYHQHNAGPNTVRNNVFAYNKDGQVGTSGTGSFTLQSNILVGERPYIQKSSKSTIKYVTNLYKTDGSLFVDAMSNDFTVLDSEEVRSIGFEPWVNIAGRYQIE